MGCLAASRCYIAATYSPLSARPLTSSDPVTVSTPLSAFAHHSTHLARLFPRFLLQEQTGCHTSRSFRPVHLVCRVFSFADRFHLLLHPRQFGHSGVQRL